MRRLGALVLCSLLGLAGAQSGAEGRVAPSAAEVRPLGVGVAVPDVPLRTPDDRVVTLHERTGKEPVVLVFFRGGW